jgi:hypothetical protein
LTPPPPPKKKKKTYFHAPCAIDDHATSALKKKEPEVQRQCTKKP